VLQKSVLCRCCAQHGCLLWPQLLLLLLLL
jgi:hypothetical protein